MLEGTLVILRSRLTADVAALHAGLQDDVETRSRADSRAWRPLSPDVASPYAPSDNADGKAAVFSIVERAGQKLAGEALLWHIDTHNRMAHIGISVLPEARGRGLALDTVRLLCYYGFTVLGLHRLQIETLADNEAMIKVALRAGFRREGTFREGAWVLGQFVDEAIFGLTAAEWSAG